MDWRVLSHVESWISAEISLFSVHGVCYRTRRRALSQLDSEYFRSAQRTRRSLRDTLSARQTNRTGRTITASEHMKRRDFITLIGGRGCMADRGEERIDQLVTFIRQ